MSVFVKLLAGGVVAASLTACVTPETGGLLTPQNEEIILGNDTGSYDVRRINVEVPRTLTTSEENTLKPRVDLLWQEEPFGDRYAQVQAIMEEGLNAGTKGLNGSQDIILDVVLTEFHAQTPRVRYTYGGEHEIQFYLTVRDAKTGEAIRPTRKIDATFPAYGGNEAVAADRAGVTQEDRILERLATVIKAELS